MPQTAVVKVSLKEPFRRVGEMMQAMHSFGITRVHLVHVRSGSQTAFYKKQYPELERLQQEGEGMGLDAEAHVLEGHAPTRIIQAAWQLDVDFIAIPWIKKPVLQQALMGSIDEDVVRMSDKPVFIYKKGFLSKTQSLDSVLYATDFKATDGKVMPYLKNKDFQARALHILHVGERAPDPSTEKARREKVKRNLQRLASECGHAYESIELLQTVGGPRRLIVRQARWLNVDLVVVGKADKPDMMTRLMGSTAEYLPHHAPCSVFIVPGRRPGNRVSRDAA
jgi:nucleotide-binding universal stress UspA family protein